MRVRIFNPDGTEAEKSGNGIRIAAKFLYDYGRITKPRAVLETKGGCVRVTLQVSKGRARLITVEMGKAVFSSTAVGMAGPKKDTTRVALRVRDHTFDVTCVSVGNPHCVVWIRGPLASVPLAQWGPAIERHPWFRRRINVQFVAVQSRRRVVIKIWERGAGDTLASGSSACAVAAACVRRGLTGRSVVVAMPGGQLKIEVRPGWNILMSGPAAEVCWGSVSGEFLDAVVP